MMTDRDPRIAIPIGKWLTLYVIGLDDDTPEIRFASHCRICGETVTDRTFDVAQDGWDELVVLVEVVAGESDAADAERHLMERHGVPVVDSPLESATARNRFETALRRSLGAT